MMADSSTATISCSGEDGSVNSPSGRRSLPFPWAQAVRRGSEPDLISSSPPLSPRGSERNQVIDPVTAQVVTQPENCNAGGVKKSAWSKPSASGVVEGTSSPVMGAASWPALSESTRTGMKSTSSPSESWSNPISDESANISPAPVMSQPPPPPKQLKPYANPNSNPNHSHQRQQPPLRRGGATGGASSGYNRPLAPPLPPPIPPPFPVFDMYANLVPQPPPYKGNNWSPRHPARRNNFNPRPVNNGGRHDRGWRAPRNPQMGPPPPPPVRGFIRPPFIPHQPIRPFGAPIGYDMGAPYVYVSTLAPPPLPMFMQYDPFLLGSILQQIEYYFSDDNLVKDNYLKSRMDKEGWVPITLIAGFHRVKYLTSDIQMIITSLRDSTSVEMKGDKLRRRADWKKWIYRYLIITFKQMLLKKHRYKSSHCKMGPLTAMGSPVSEVRMMFVISVKVNILDCAKILQFSLDA